MTETEHIAAIYQCLPPNARHETLDFMLFLRARYATGSVEGQSAQAATILKEVGFIGGIDAEPTLSENYKDD